MSPTDPGLEGITLASWLYTVLSQDAQLQGLASAGGVLVPLSRRVVDGVYAGPDSTPWWVSFNVLETHDVKVADMTQVMGAVPVQVKVVGAVSSYGPLVAPYRRVHAILEGRTNQLAAAGQVLTCHRVSGVQYPERTEGIEYRHLGGLYDTNVQ